MVSGNELVTLFVAVGSGVFILLNLGALSRAVPSWGLLFAAFFSLFAGCVLAILEGFWQPRILNLGEHAAYLLTSLLATVWCFKAFFHAGENRP